MEQNLSEETANKWQNHSFISNKCVSQAIISTPTSNKNELWTNVKVKGFQKPQLQSVLILCCVIYTF